MAKTADQRALEGLPASSTFAASRDDVLASLNFFFGDPASPEKLKDYSEHHAMTYHFPDAFYGQNTKIRETLNNLILNSPQDWQTGVALPFVRIQGTTVEWDEIKFDVRLLQRVPYEGISRMQTSLRRRHRDRIVRRGIAMTIESDFYATEAGRAHFTDQLTSIRYCVQETCNFDTMFAYLTCGNYDFRYDISKGLRPRRSARTALAHEIMFYAITQKEGLGLDKAVEEAKTRMSRYSVTPNMLVVPPQLLLYMALAPEEKLDFSKAGPAGPARFEAGVQGYSASTFRGLGVFQNMPFEVNDDSDAMQLLQRSTQVGEFYRMKAPRIGKLAPNYMDVVIYDEESDKHVHITFADALKYARWDQLSDEYKQTIVDAHNAAKPKEGAYDLQVGSTMANIVGAVAKANPEWVGIEIVLVRPFIEHLMQSAVMAVAGRDTGATLFGPADMQISANTSVKTIEGCHTKSVITKPQNVLVLRDVSCAGYVAGGNTRFFGEAASGNAEKINVRDIKDSINRRLSFEDGDGEYESMLAFVAPSGDGAKRDQVISISQRFLPWEVQKGSKDYFPGGQAGFDAYKDIGLESIHFGEDVRAAENMEFIANGSLNNALCFVGPHRVYSPWSATYQDLVPGQGHFGPDALPGDARWRRGEAVSAQTARSTMVGVEAATHSMLVYGNRGPN